MSAPRVLVLTGVGINCEQEMAAAFDLAGGVPEIVHLSELLQGRVSLSDYPILALPGGFSFGDNLGAGTALAHRIRHRRLPDGKTLFRHLASAIDAGAHVVGVCNGFQVLVELGLLPNAGGTRAHEAALLPNLSGRFEDRWVEVGAHAKTASRAFAALHGAELPVRHGEGRLVFRDADVRDAVVQAGLNGLFYRGADGRPTEAYPANPNGSELACAGLSDPTGRVIGLMPHPEAALSVYNHYDWPRRRLIDPEFGEPGAGLALFRAMVDAVANHGVDRYEREEGL